MSPKISKVNNHVSLYLLKVFTFFLCCVVSDKLWFGLMDLHMDRSSILGDAIDYLKELLQRISDLHNELESTPTPPGSLPPTPSSFHPLTPTTHTLSFLVKEELCPSSLPSPKG